MFGAMVCFSVRELSNIALYQSLSRTNTLTTSVEKTKRNCIDKQDLLDRITILVSKRMPNSRLCHSLTLCRL